MAKKIIIILAIIILAGFVAYKGVSMFGKNKISGRLIDASLVRGAQGKITLLVLTDGSLRYISKSRRPGKTVTGQKGLFCKTYLYLYDPASGRVMSQRKTKYDSPPPDMVLIPVKGKIWEASIDKGYDKPHLRVIDGETGNIIMTTKEFLGKFQELSRGVAQIIGFVDWPPYLEIHTSSGKTLYYDLESEKLYQDKRTFLDALDGVVKKITLFKLVDPTGGVQQHLYRIEGPPSKLCHTSIMESYFEKPSLIQRFYQAEVQPILQDKVFLDGWIAYQDNELAVIGHQDQIGENSPRRITCVNSNGEILWSLSQKEIFPALARRQKDAFSGSTFVKSRLKVKRSGDILLMVMEGQGIMAVQARTGQILWKLDV